VEYGSKRDNTENGSFWNHLKIIQKLPEQHIYQESTESRNFGHCADTLVSTNVKVQNIINLRDNIAYCKYRATATLQTLETWFVSGI